MATRTITATILRPNGDPWAGGVVRFALLDDAFTVSPPETVPMATISAVADDDGAMTVTLVSGLSSAYRVTLPDREQFDIAVPDGATTTLEALRAAYSGSPIPQVIIEGPTGPAGPAGNAGPTGPTGAISLSVADTPSIDLTLAGSVLSAKGATVINVKDAPYNAVGDDVTDDTAAFEAAFAAGRHVVVPGHANEVYVVTKIDGIQSGTVFEGVGNPTLKVKPSTTVDPLLLSVNAVDDVTVRGITFDGNTSGITSFSNVVLVFDSGHVTFEHCRFQHCEGIAAFIGGTSHHVKVIDCEFEDCGQSVWLVSGNPADRKQALAFSGTEHPQVRSCDFKDVGLDCISMAGGCSDVYVVDNDIDTNYAGSVYISGAVGGIVRGNRIKNGGGNGVDCPDSIDVTISENVIENCQSAGILVAADNVDVRGISLTGNVCKNNFQGVSSHVGGITFHVHSGALMREISVSGNVCYDDQGAGNVTQRHAIGIVNDGGTFDNIIIGEDNAFVGYSAAGLPDPLSVFQTKDLFNPKRDLFIVDNFTSLISTTAIGELGWGLMATGTGGGALQAGELRHPGIMERSTGATTASLGGMRLAASSGGIFDPDDFFEIIWLFRLMDNDANTLMRIGAGQDSAADPPSNGIYLEKLAADTQWFGVCRNGGAQTRTAALLTCDTDYHEIRLRRVNSTTIGFKLDALAEVNLTTNITGAAINPFMYIINSASANKRLRVDRFSLRVNGLA